MSESAGGAVRMFHYVPQANRPSEEQPKLMTWNPFAPSEIEGAK